MNYTITTAKENLKHKEIVMVAYTVNYPVFEGAPKKNADKMNGFYKRVAGGFIAYIKRELYPEAVSDFGSIEDEKEQRRFKGFSTQLEFIVCTDNGRILSLYFDVKVFKLDKLSVYRRYAQNWDLRGGFIYPADAVIDMPTASKLAGSAVSRRLRHDYYIDGDEVCFFEFAKGIDYSSLRRSEYKSVIHEYRVPLEELKLKLPEAASP